MVNESILELPSMRNNLKLSDNLLRSKGKMSMGRKEDGARMIIFDIFLSYFKGVWSSKFFSLSSHRNDLDFMVTFSEQ